jgi:p-hydroxybenzoate 3-monooxygenase
MHTQVAIIGAGPSGLLLGQLLHLKGIDSVILESRNQEYVVDRVRAGVLEQFTADFMDALGVGERLHRDGMHHEDVYLSFDGKRRLIPLAYLTRLCAVQHAFPEGHTALYPGTARRGHSQLVR